jgi:hypothetical protein
VVADLAPAEGTRRGAGHARQPTIPGDGAARIRGTASSNFPHATHIADLSHAREHLHHLARLLEFTPGDRKEEWLAGRLHDPDHGDIDRIGKAARVCPLVGAKKDEPDTAAGYFQDNAPRMRRQRFRSRGSPAGSGAVQAGCQPVIGQRLKLSGMPRTAASADAITTLRCQQASRPEDQIRHAPRNQTPAA